MAAIVMRTGRSFARELAVNILGQDQHHAHLSQAKLKATINDRAAGRCTQYTARRTETPAARRHTYIIAWLRQHPRLCALLSVLRTP